MHSHIAIEFFKRRYGDDLRKHLVAAVYMEDRKSVRNLLSEMKARTASDPVTLFDYMFFSAYFYNNMLIKEVDYDFSSRDFTPEDCVLVEELLELFEIHEDDSRYAGIYDHFFYLDSWKDLIWSYLSYMKYNELYNVSMESQTNDSMLVQHNDCAINFCSILALGDERLIELMKRHDRLLLEMIPLHPDPKELGDMGIFDGTQKIIDRMLLNLSFPASLVIFCLDTRLIRYA